MKGLINVLAPICTILDDYAKGEPRPMRLVKKTMMVRPYISEGILRLACIHLDDDNLMNNCGPVQAIEIEVEEY